MKLEDKVKYVIRNFSLLLLVRLWTEVVDTEALVYACMFYLSIYVFSVSFCWFISQIHQSKLLVSTKLLSQTSYIALIFYFIF